METLTIATTRRIDTLGRITVPSEIRRRFNINESDTVEILADRNGIITLRKKSLVSEQSEFAQRFVKSLYRTAGPTICVTDMDTVIAAAGKGKNNLLDKPLSPELRRVLIGRVVRFTDISRKNYIPIIQGQDAQYKYEAITPLILNGDLIGSMVLLSEAEPFTEADKGLVLLAATLFGKMMEGGATC